MKKLILLAFATALGINAQTYSSLNISRLGLIAPNTTTNNSVNKYSGCWGWYQASKNKEYALSGASIGTYFIDITNPATPSVSAFVPSKSVCTWRELKTYSHYAYIVSDVCQPNALQIVDLQYLPDSVHVVYNDNKLFTLGHTIWIDNDLMYVASTTFTQGVASPMTVWSLANPELPQLLRKVEQDIGDNIIHEVHDMYFRNDTGYVSAGWSGLKMVKFNRSTNTFSLIGSYSNYEDAGYNHSSSLTQNGKYLVFCDEVPTERAIHMVDVQNLANVQPMTSWHPFPRTTPHNPFVIGNRWAVVSCYEDGLFIYDISVPFNVKLVGYYDTYYQNGYNTGSGTVAPTYSGYEGNWGAYPYLPSKVIIANDMENGVFLLDASAAYSTSSGTTVVVGTELPVRNLIAYPNPARDRINVQYAAPSSSSVELMNILGEAVTTQKFNGEVNTSVDLSALPSGNYILRVSSQGFVSTRKVSVCH